MNARAWPVMPRIGTALTRALAVWLRRARDRRALAHLTARERHDMGLSRTAVEEEIRKPFWRA